MADKPTYEKLEDAQQQAVQALNERVKELRCLYSISKLVEKPDISLEEISQGIVDLIPHSMRYPKITCVRLIVEDREFTTEDFQETIWKLYSKIMVYGKHKGCLEVFYVHEETEDDRRQFLKEERDLITAIAERIGRIIERKQAEERLQTERDNMINILNSMEDGMYIVNQKHDIEYVNSSLIKDFGPFEGRKCFEYFHDRNESCPWCKNEDVFAGKTVHWEWYSFKNQKTYDLIDTPLKNPDGSISKLEIFRDITAIKRTEKEIQDLKRQIEFILGATKTGIDIIDSDFNIRYIDPEWQKAYGSSEGKKCYEYFMDRKEVCPGCGIIKALKTKNTIVSEQVLVKENNRPVYVTTIPFQDSNDDWLVAEVNVDITDRKRLEAQVIQSAKMASLGIMAGGIAHEIRNPLAVCSSAAQLMVQNPNNRVLREECADKIYSNVHRASHIIENLLKFARTPGDDFWPVNLNDALELSLSIIEQQFKTQQIELNRKFTKDLPRVMGNANLLQQVFLALILNACNAMPKGGKLTVSTLANSDGDVDVRFVDTGCGIPEENLDKIFDPFFTTMPAGKGVGLGLSISYEIIQQHNGSIEVESRVDVGSTFTIKLPSTQ